MKLLSIIVLLLVCFFNNPKTFVRGAFEFQVSSVNWVSLVSTNGIKFTSRNAHASCVYKGQIWVTGGFVNLYPLYNLLNSIKMSDVWHSLDGQNWVQEIRMRGDFFAQNSDVIQPGPLAPWWYRYGHTLDAVNSNYANAIATGASTDPDLMIQLGGFGPNPMNDIWITTDGQTWVYCGLAPWSERAWHKVGKGHPTPSAECPLERLSFFLDTE